MQPNKQPIRLLCSLSDTQGRQRLSYLVYHCNRIYFSMMPPRFSGPFVFHWTTGCLWGGPLVFRIRPPTSECLNLAISGLNWCPPSPPLTPTFLCFMWFVAPARRMWLVLFCAQLDLHRTHYEMRYLLMCAQAFFGLLRP